MENFFNLDFILTGEQLKDFVYLNDFKTSDGNDLKSYIDKICKMKTELNDIIVDLGKSRVLFKKYEIDLDDDSFTYRIEEISTIISELTIAQFEFENVLKEKQAKCDHVSQYDGHDSHYDYYFCNKCGLYERC